MKRLHVLPYVNMHLLEQVVLRQGGKVCAASFLTKLNKRQEKKTQRKETCCFLLGFFWERINCVRAGI